MDVDCQVITDILADVLLQLEAKQTKCIELKRD